MLALARGRCAFCDIRPKECLSFFFFLVLTVGEGKIRWGARVHMAKSVVCIHTKR